MTQTPSPAQPSVHYEVEVLTADRTWHIHQTTFSLPDARDIALGLGRLGRGYRLRAVEATKRVKEIETYLPGTWAAGAVIISYEPDQPSGDSGALAAEPASPPPPDELETLRKENDLLRRLLAESPAACVHCSLPAERMAECAHGFPGCARADDLMLAGGPTMTPEMEAELAESNARHAALSPEDSSFDELDPCCPSS